MVGHLKVTFIRLRALARHLVACRRGNVTMMFAIALLPIFGAIGIAVDYANAVRIRGNLQHAVDAAVLSSATGAGQGTTPTASRVTALVKASLARSSSLPTPAIAVSLATAGVVGANVSVSVPTGFMQVLGIPAITVGASSQAGYGVGPVELALVLDTTASMAGAKLTNLQSAATSLVNTVFAAPNAATNVKMSLVPFSSYVNVGLTYRNAAWLSNTTDSSSTSTQCWTTYPNAIYALPLTTTGTCYADGSPYSCSTTTYQSITLGTPVNQCGPVTYTYTWYGCVGSRAYPLDMADTVSAGSPVPGMSNIQCSDPLQRLTNSQASIISQIGALTAAGETYIPSGLIWGWRTLSPNAPFADAKPYHGPTSKVMILMTDGFNTHSPNYPDHEGTDTSLANMLTAQLCSNIRAQGIQIYTIAFQVTDPNIKSILSACADGPPYFFDASTVGSIQTAFSTIAGNLTSAHLLR